MLHVGVSRKFQMPSEATYSTLQKLKNTAEAAELFDINTGFTGLVKKVTIMCFFPSL